MKIIINEKEKVYADSLKMLLESEGFEVNIDCDTNENYILSFGNTSLDLQACTLHCGDNKIQLSAREYHIMHLFMQNPKNVLSKDFILTHVWGYDSDAVENNVEVYIGFLRKKLKRIGSNIQIYAIRRLGYHMELH